jgi:membrane protein
MRRQVAGPEAVRGPMWWWQLIVQVTKQLQAHNAELLAGGVAMYGLLSVFPGLAAAVSIYGLFATPDDVIQHLRVFAGVLPPGVWEIFSTQLQEVVAHDHGTLTVAATIGVLIALWSARLTMSALMVATTIAYEHQEKRGFLYQLLISLILTLGLIVGFVVMVLIGVVVPLVVAVLGTSPSIQLLVDVLRWLLLWAFAVIGLSVVYHYAPAREHARWRWASLGSVLAATLWLAVSGLFSLYVRTVAGYDRTYGALGGVVVLLMWFYLLSFIVVVGAEVNAVLDQRLLRSDRSARHTRLT